MKKMILGLTIGIMVGMSTNAFAAIGDKVQAIFADFHYVVDGEDKVIDSPVLVYEGTSYVRTTQIANLLGFDVTYKSNSRTIEFNNPNLENPKTTSAQQPKEEIAPSPTPKTSQNIENVIASTPVPSSTVVATIAPTPTATPLPDNTARCQVIRDNNTLEMAGFNESHDPFNGNTVYLRGLLVSQQNAKLALAGCN